MTYDWIYDDSWWPGWCADAGNGSLSCYERWPGQCVWAVTMNNHGRRLKMAQVAGHAPTLEDAKAAAEQMAAVIRKRRGWG